MIEAAVRARLLQDDVLQVGAKIYSWKAPEGVVAPYVVISRAGEDIQTVSKGDPPIRMTALQIALYTLDAAFAVDKLAVIRTRLQNFQGTLAGYYIQSCQISLQTITDRETATKLYGALAVYEVAYWPAP